MPKRPISDDDSPQPLKVQVNSKQLCRKIHSSASEKTLQMLFNGASKPLQVHGTKGNVTNDMCFRCCGQVVGVNCNYCEQSICGQCTNFCYKCQQNYCPNCSYQTYDHRESICFSC